MQDGFTHGRDRAGMMNARSQIRAMVDTAQNPFRDEGDRSGRAGSLKRQHLLRVSEGGFEMLEIDGLRKEGHGSRFAQECPSALEDRPVQLVDC